MDGNFEKLIREVFADLGSYSKLVTGFRMKSPHGQTCEVYFSGKAPGNVVEVGRFRPRRWRRYLVEAKQKSQLGWRIRQREPGVSEWCWDHAAAILVLPSGQARNCGHFLMPGGNFRAQSSRGGSSRIPA
jgi:hypothetical protein